MIFGPDGKLLCNHRKLKPTGAERIVWGDADRDFFPTVDSPWGTMGALICWENYMRLPAWHCIRRRQPVSVPQYQQ